MGYLSARIVPDLKILHLYPILLFHPIFSLQTPPSFPYHGKEGENERVERMEH